MELERANILLKKIHKLIESKNLSLFETFIYLDSNTSNKISQLELKLGLISLGIGLPPSDIISLWKLFRKSSSVGISFYEFFYKFISSGAVELISTGIDTSDESERLRKFALEVKKMGTMEVVWAKIDKNSSGAVTVKEFLEASSKFSIISNPEDAEKVFYYMIRDEVAMQN